jgi:hypothetical protein
LSLWVEAGIRLAASNFKISLKKEYPGSVFLSRGKHEKPLYHLVWKRWPIWQTEKHIKAMCAYTVSAGAHEDLIHACPGAAARYSATQVKDACKRLGLPLRI